MVGMVYTTPPEEAVFLDSNTIPAKKLNHGQLNAKVHVISGVIKNVARKEDEDGKRQHGHTNQHWCDMTCRGRSGTSKSQWIFVTSCMLALFLFCTHQPCLKLLNVAHSNKST